MTSDAEIRRLFALIDARDPDAVAAHFADDIRLQMGGGPTLYGRDAAHAAFATARASFAAIRHDIRRVLRAEGENRHDVVAVEADVTYTLGSGQVVTVPCTSTLEFVGKMVVDYRIFIDLTPVIFARRAANEQKVRDFLRYLEAMDIGAWGRLIADDAVQENPYAPPNFPSRFVGGNVIRDHYATLPDTYDWMRFPDLVFHPSADPDLVIAEFRGDIKLKGEERKYDHRYCCFFYFNGEGKIKYYREYFNPLVLNSSFDGAVLRLHALGRISEESA